MRVQGQPGEPSKVIALIASAGGLDALTQVLEPLPADLPAAVVALQHLRPEGESVLPHLLAARTALRVCKATDGLPLVEGTVLVAPAGKHLLFTADHTAALINSGGFPPSRPSADLLLTSLALAVGSRLVAVVLTGKGNDAATGMAAVHRFGGTVIACDEGSSRYFDMPAATIALEHVVDFVLPLQDIPVRLVDLVRRP